MESIEATRKLIVDTMRVEASKKVQERARINVAPKYKDSTEVVIVTIPGSLTVHGSCDYFWQTEDEATIVERVQRIARHAEDFGPHCNYEIQDGNQDDPSYAYCGLRLNHGGEHGEWEH